MHSINQRAGRAPATQRNATQRRTNTAMMELHQSFAQAGTVGVLSVCFTAVLLKVRDRREISPMAKLHGACFS